MSLPEPRLEPEQAATSKRVRRWSDPETAVALFRTAFVVVMVVTLALRARPLGSFLALYGVSILAALYNMGLLLMYWRGAYLPGRRHFILSLDIVFVSMWIGLSRALGLSPAFFPLYYALVFIGTLWFGIIGAALTALVSGAFYFGILEAARRGLLGAVAAPLPRPEPERLVALFLVVVLSGYIYEAQRREREGFQETRRELDRYQIHHRLMQEFYDLVTPQTLLSPPGLEVGVAFRAAVRMGAGDYYDVLGLEGGGYALCVADVAGKYGAEVLRVPVVKYALKVATAVERRPALVVERVNELVFDELQPDRFVTMFYAHVDPWAGEVTYVNAGHEPPLLIRGDGSVEQLQVGGLVLGVLRDSRYEEQRVRVTADDVLLLYTDGAVEALEAAGEESGLERLRQIAHEAIAATASANDAATRIMNQVCAAVQPRQPRDDVTIMVARAERRAATLALAAQDDASQASAPGAAS